MPDVAARTLILTRIFQAPRTKVFEAWTRPDLVAAWWGPEGFRTVSYDMDIRPGGAYRLTMQSPAGTLHRKRGVYQEIVAPERIVFTFAWEDESGVPGPQTLITVTLEDLGDATRLTFRQAVFPTVEACEDHRDGWTSCLQRFANWLAAGPPSAE